MKSVLHAQLETEENCRVCSRHMEICIIVFCNKRYSKLNGLEAFAMIVNLWIWTLSTLG